MNQLIKTGIFVGAAAVLALAAWLVVPKEGVPSVFKDQGQPFFKSFSPLDVGAIEITGYDEQQGGARPFKVEFRDGRWRIPSAEGYAADVKDQLARMTALFIDLKKGEMRSDRESRFEEYGVLDPRDEKIDGGKGRGRRVTLRDMGGAVLADLIIGNSVEGSSGYCYVREPGNNRVYTCKLDPTSVSTRFASWVETDLLKLGAAQVKKIVFDNYTIRLDRLTIDQARQRLAKGRPQNLLSAQQTGLNEVTFIERVPAEPLTFDRNAEGKWAMEGGLPANNDLDAEKIDSASSTLSALTLVGVRRRPAGLLEAIQKLEKGLATGSEIDEATASELEKKLKPLTDAGYYPMLSAEGKKLQILSSQGEIRVSCDDGVVYTLRMGGIEFGDPDQLADATRNAPTTKPGEAKSEREHRWLFVTVDFDARSIGPKPTPPDPTTRPATTRPTTQPAASTTRPTTTPSEDDALAQAEYKMRLGEYEKKVKDGRKRRDELASKFDEWYYIVDADAYAKLKLDKKAILKPAPTTQPTTLPAIPLGPEIPPATTLPSTAPPVVTPPTPTTRPFAPATTLPTRTPRPSAPAAAPPTTRP